MELLLKRRVSNLTSSVPNISTLAILIRQEIIPKCQFGIPRMNFPEFPGSVFFLAFLYSLVGSPELPGIIRHLPGEGFWDPQIAYSGEDEVDMLGSGEPYL